ncbi:MAG: hypothetical protein KAW95_02840 [Dehalococcoidia bacterium]|nr:hypothetical protein [Dehalococcoidia bacterium]
MPVGEKSGRDVHVEPEVSVEQLSKRLKMLDERLDNLDSVITSLVERVMEKPLAMEVVCPKCGQPIQIGITGNVRMRG